MSYDSRTTGRNFIGVTITIFAAKLLGFVREIAFASIFGTSILTDIYQTVFSLPSLLFSSIGTALSSVNIPNLTYYVTSMTKEERDRYIAVLYAQITLWAAVISVAGIVFAPAVAKLIAPGLEGEAASIAVIITRVMMPTFLFVNLTFVTTGVLQVHGHFLRAAAISIPYNILIIASLFLKGDDILFISYVTTIGWLLQFLFQVPVLLKEKYRLSFLKIKNSYMAKMLKQLVPVLLGNSLLQLCLIIDRSFGTHLDEGTTAALSFGSNLFVTITSIFIVAMSSVVFPRISKYCLDRDFMQLCYLLSNVWKMLLFILLPYLVLVAAYHNEIIALIYERGAFTSRSTMMTGCAFLFYSFAVIGYAGQEIFNRVYYALKKFSIPMTVSLVCLAVNVFLDIIFLKSGIIALSGATAGSLLLYAAIMTTLVTKEVGTFLTKDFMLYLLKLLIPVTLMLVVIIGFKRLDFDGLLLPFVLPAFISCLVYLGAGYLIGLTAELNLREASSDNETAS